MTRSKPRFSAAIAVVALIPLSLTAALAGATCTFPGNPGLRMPDGATASKEEMMEAQMAVKAYVAQMEVYVECLDNEAKALTATGVMTDEQRAINDKRYNSAVELMEGVAEQFNVQVRLFRDANT